LEAAMATRRVADATAAMTGVTRRGLDPARRPEARGEPGRKASTSVASVASVSSVASVASSASSLSSSSSRLGTSGTPSSPSVEERATRFKAWLEACPPEWRELFDAP